MKKVFNKKFKVDNFQIGDLVLKWDVGFEDKGKHGKFDHLWKGTFKIASYHGNNAYILQSMSEELITSGLVNLKFLNHYIT